MFHKSEIVIVNERLYHLGIKKTDLAENIFFVGDPARALGFLKSLTELILRSLIENI